jgi:hypothetical protein
MDKDLRSTFNLLKQDLSSSLPRQVRAVVQLINGEVQVNAWKGSPGPLILALPLTQVVWV